MTNEPPRLRMAPAPSGFLHLGNIRTFLFDYLYARGNGGRLVLRVEDTDASRSTGEAELAIFQSLKWLGIDWDEGPDVGGAFGPYRQTERERFHQEAAHRLLETGSATTAFVPRRSLMRNERSSRPDVKHHGMAVAAAH